ncbi:MAG: dodecin domain-containing protein [Deltaproteobacteria bacterium]|nr:MAG: dodecin domain-containing protein [Deltaproteobacteria bacterium]
MDSVYKVIEIVGTSKTSWEEASRNAVETAGKSLEDLRVAEIVKLDMAIDKNKVVAYRARVNISFKYRSERRRSRRADWHTAMRDGGAWSPWWWSSC